MILRWIRRRTRDGPASLDAAAECGLGDRDRPQLRRVFVRLNVCCVDRAREYDDDADAAVVVAELDRLCREMLAERDERHRERAAEDALSAAWWTFREGIIRAAMRGGAR